MTAICCAAAISTLPDASDAVRAATVEARASLGAAADLAVAFVSHRYAPDWDALAPVFHDAAGAPTSMAATGESIVAGGREVEDAPCVAVWLASFSAARLWPMRLELAQTAEGPAIVGWPDEAPEHWSDDGALLLLGDPYSFPADFAVERLNEDQAGAAVLGGMASGGAGPDETRLALDGRSLARGAAAVLIQGVRVCSVVSQGCRPVGGTFVVTRAERNLVYELGGKSALEQLQTTFAALAPSDQRRLQRGPHLGLALDEYRDQFATGDFLVRNIVGADAASGMIAIGDTVRVGQTVQFHVRDEQAADADLAVRLADIQRREPTPPVGGLLFTCNGRGTRLFSGADHDAAAVQAVFPGLPLAGFFAQGELGPVAGRNFLHGFTASLALFYDAG